MAAPKKPGKFRVHAVGDSSITAKWKHRARNERRFKVRSRRHGESAWKVKRVRRNRRKVVIRKLEPGTLHELQVRVCGRGGCSAWSPTRTQATLLAPYGDPYPGLGGCGAFPASGAAPGAPSAADLSAWNQVGSGAPLHPDSAAIIDRILSEGGDSFHPDFGSNPEYGIPYTVVPGVQPDVPVGIGPDGYPDESDFGPAPIPPRAPIEAGSDGHALVIERDGCELYELYRAEYRGGTKNRWVADATAHYDLDSTALRPAGFTSADAAGLPIFPGLVRYDEVASGLIDHALRITFSRTRQAFIAPATHHASSSCDADLPAMGMRVRLSAGYDTSGLEGQSAVIAAALKRYGAFVADNGSNFYVTGTTDSRWNDEDLNQMKEIPGSAFEVVRSAAPAVTPC